MMRMVIWETFCITEFILELILHNQTKYLTTKIWPVIFNKGPGDENARNPKAKYSDSSLTLYPWAISPSGKAARTRAWTSKALKNILLDPIDSN